MTRSPLGRCVVRCVGTMSSGRGTTVRRQQTASHDEKVQLYSRDSTPKYLAFGAGCEVFDVW